MIIEKIKSKRDQLALELAIIEPLCAPLGIVQLLHGMAEHKERYFDFMKYLAENGYISVIHDHRGHGASVNDSSHFGYFYTEDIAFQVTEYIKNKYSSLPVALFSHSMGTLVARNFLKKYNNQIDRIILSGPPTEKGPVNIALVLAKLAKLFYGKYSPNRFLNSISLGPYNKGYTVNNSWICSNPAVVSAYNADPLCGFVFTTNGFINLYKLLKSAFNSKEYNLKNTALPILLLAGADDPVIHSKEKFAALEKFLHDVGYENTSHKLYENKRHEILNEEGKLDIYKDILAFISSKND